MADFEAMQECVRRLYEEQEVVTLQDIEEGVPDPPLEYQLFDYYDSLDEELYWAVIDMFSCEPPITYGPVL